MFEDDFTPINDPAAGITTNMDRIPRDMATIFATRTGDCVEAPVTGAFSAIGTPESTVLAEFMVS